MRTIVVAMVTAALLALPAPAMGAYARDGPAIMTAVQWDAGTLVSWSPSLEEGAVYRLYRGSSTEDLVPIALTSTPSYYDFKGDAGRRIVYAVTIIVDGVESKPTYRTVDSAAACVSASMNGSFVVRPYNCLPLS